MKINYQPIRNFFFSQNNTQENYYFKSVYSSKKFHLLYMYMNGLQNLNKERSLHFFFLRRYLDFSCSVWKRSSLGRFVIYHLFKWLSNHAGTPALVEVPSNSTISNRNRFWLTPSLLKRAKNILGNPANWKQSIKHELVQTSSVSNALTEKKLEKRSVGALDQV